MVFQPSMEQDATDGFYALVEGLLEDVFNFASLVPRVAKHKELSDYLSDVEEVRDMKITHVHAPNISTSVYCSLAPYSPY